MVSEKQKTQVFVALIAAAKSIGKRGMVPRKHQDQTLVLKDFKDPVLLNTYVTSILGEQPDKEFMDQVFNFIEDRGLKDL